MISTYILFVVFISCYITYCSKGKKPPVKQQEAKATEGVVLKTPNATDKPMVVSVITNQSERTQNKKATTTKEVSEEDGDMFAELKKKLAAKPKPNENNTESFLAEDEANPLANFIIPERPNPKKMAANSRKDNIVAMPMIRTNKLTSAMTQETDDNGGEKEGRIMSRKMPSGMVVKTPSVVAKGPLVVDVTQNSEQKNDLKTQSATDEPFPDPVINKPVEPVIRPIRVKRVAKKMGGATTESQASEAEGKVTRKIN